MINLKEKILFISQYMVSKLLAFGENDEKTNTTLIAWPCAKLPKSSIKLLKVSNNDVIFCMFNV